jgi:hypothetical protein
MDSPCRASMTRIRSGNDKNDSCSGYRRIARERNEGYGKTVKSVIGRFHTLIVFFSEPLLVPFWCR